MSAQRRVRVALVDDQALVLRGLSALLRDFGDVDVVVEAGDGAQLLHALAERPVDVVVSDIRMPGLDGIALIRALRTRGDTTPVLLLTTFEDPEALLAAVDAGAQGFLLKDASPDDLHAAILRVREGETLLQPVALAAVRDHWRETSGSARVRLSEREISILRLVAGGYSNKEIGRSLRLTEGTVKNYISDLLVKLDCRDRTHAVLKAITQRLL